MKTLYRQGLKNRYGSLMQVIAGVHFNFSMPDSFWCEWQDLVGGLLQPALYLRQSTWGLFATSTASAGWCPYLFGASPAICDSFLKGRKSSLPFQKTGKGTSLPAWQPPCACPIRLPNSAQAGLQITMTACPPM